MEAPEEWTFLGILHRYEGIMSHAAHVYHQNYTEFAVIRRVSKRRSRFFRIDASNVWHNIAVSAAQRRQELDEFLGT